MCKDDRVACRTWIKATRLHSGLEQNDTYPTIEHDGNMTQCAIAMYWPLFRTPNDTWLPTKKTTQFASARMIECIAMFVGTSST